MTWQRGLYSLLMYCLLPLFLLRLYWRGRVNPAYRQRIAERFAHINLATISPKRLIPQKIICLHAVSVGETIAARPLVEALLQAYPHYTVWITSTTPTGSEMVQRLFAKRVQHSYLPYDLPHLMARFVARLRPQLLIVMETELWPNLYHSCQQYRVPIVLANARLSAQSTRAYQRIRGLISPTLASIHTIAARSAHDVAHFQQLGAQAMQCQIMGNIKFDLQINTDYLYQARQLREKWGNECLIWVVASTHAGEDEIILTVFAALRQVIPTLRLILVPRHPERFPIVAKICQQSDFFVKKRSESAHMITDSPDFDILLGDTLGELLLWYACADVAFIGGSLIEQGGHNPLEAAAFQVPIVTGASIHNFTDIYPLLLERGGAVMCESKQALQAQLLQWLQQEKTRTQAGKAAGQVFTENTGAVKRLMPILSQLL